jgi:hypothetical protein
MKEAERLAARLTPVQLAEGRARIQAFVQHKPMSVLRDNPIEEDEQPAG